MKYIITENRMELMIKEYIIKSFDAFDVEFTTRNVHLGSGPNEKGETSVKQKVINVYFNYLKDKKSYSELRQIKSELWNILPSLFGVDFESYGSEWDLKVYILKREEI